LTSNGIITKKQTTNFGKILIGRKTHTHGQYGYITRNILFFFLYFRPQYWLKVYNKITITDINRLTVKHTSGFSLSCIITFALKYTNHRPFSHHKDWDAFYEIIKFPVRTGICVFRMTLISILLLAQYCGYQDQGREAST
jgi:hypothetical protein